LTDIKILLLSCILFYHHFLRRVKEKCLSRRYRENCSRLRSGGIYGIADVFIFLKHKQQEKGLSASEQKMLSLTMRLLREELLCIGCAEEEVYGAIS